LPFGLQVSGCLFHIRLEGAFVRVITQRRTISWIKRSCFHQSREYEVVTPGIKTSFYDCDIAEAQMSRFQYFLICREANVDYDGITTPISPNKLSPKFKPDAMNGTVFWLTPNRLLAYQNTTAPRKRGSVKAGMVYIPDNVSTKDRPG
jgi:hypothetical protein